VAKRKLIITLHINGPSRDTTPHVPYSPEEIAHQAVECWRQGASVVHYHATHPVTGAQSSDVALYAETVKRIKKECDLITFPTLGAHAAPSEGRVSHIVEMAKDPATKPDCIPVDILTTNIDSYDVEKKAFTSLDRVYSNTTRTLIDIAKRVRAVGVKPVPMMWNVAGVRVTQALVEMGVFAAPLFCEVSVFGEPHLGFGHPATVKGLDALIDFFPPGADWRWTVSVIGANAFAVLADAIERGGDVAVGLHDYPYPELGFPTNAELVARVVDLARAMGREVATAVEAREMLGMT
jgi:3-keto-5-aminohexanoate cleavage enzyme